MGTRPNLKAHMGTRLNLGLSLNSIKRVWGSVVHRTSINGYRKTLYNGHHIYM